MQIFKINKKKVILTLIFFIFIYSLGCFVTYYSTKCQCECIDTPEISYGRGIRMAEGQRCYFSIFIPFEDFYKEPHCCITSIDIIFAYLKIMILVSFFYTVYSIIEFYAKKRRVIK